jgi:hypothetical protein
MNVVEIIISAIDQTHKGFTSAINNTADLQKAASAMATVVVTELTAAAVAVAVLTDKAISNAAEMGKMAQRIGEPVQELSKFAYAANVVGIANDSMEKGIKKLDVAITEAAGNMQSKAGRAFEALSINVVGLNGKVKTQGQVFLEVAEKFAGYQDGAQKSALAAQIFGERIGTQMIPLLNKGAEGVRDLMSETSGVSAEFSKQAIEYEENVTRLKKSVNAVGKEVAQFVLPYLVSFTDQLVKIQREYGVFSALGMTVVDVLKGLAVAVYGVYTVFQILGKFIADVLFVEFEALYAVVKVVTDAFKFQFDVISALVEGFINLGDTARKVGLILYEFFSGNFKEAGKIANSALDGLKANMIDTGKKIADSWSKNSGDATKALTDAWDAARSTAKLFVADVQKDFAKLSSFSIGIFTPKPKAKDEPDTRPPAPIFDNNDVLKREQALRQLADLEAQMNERSLEGAAALTAGIEKVYTDRMNKIAALEEGGQLTYFEILDAQLMAYQEYQAKITKALEQHLLQRADLENAEKTANMQRYVELQNMRMEDYMREKGLFNELKQLSAQQRRQTLADAEAEFHGKQELMQAYVNLSNKAHRTITSYMAQAFNTVYNSISNHITNAIMGTEKWGDAVKAIGMEFVQMLVQFAVQWVAAQVIMAVAGKAIMAASVALGLTSATALAGAWAAAATGALIATFGGAGASAALLPAEIATNVAFAKSAAIVGMAHSGLDYVPREGTYLLQEGEGVLRRDENAARMQGRGLYNNDGQTIEMVIQIDGETLGRKLFKMAKSGRLQFQVA